MRNARMLRAIRPDAAWAVQLLDLTATSFRTRGPGGRSMPRRRRPRPDRVGARRWVVGCGTRRFVDGGAPRGGERSTHCPRSRSVSPPTSCGAPARWPASSRAPLVRHPRQRPRPRSSRAGGRALVGRCRSRRRAPLRVRPPPRGLHSQPPRRPRRRRPRRQPRAGGVRPRARPVFDSSLEHTERWLLFSLRGPSRTGSSKGGLSRPELRHRSNRAAPREVPSRPAGGSTILAGLRVGTRISYGDERPRPQPREKRG